MGDWERCCKNLEKKLPKELHDKLNDCNNKLKEMNFEEFGVKIAKLPIIRQRIWLLRETSNIFYTEESYHINDEALEKWRKEYPISDDCQERFNEFIYYYEAFLSEISERNCVERWKSALDDWDSAKKTVTKKKVRTRDTDDDKGGGKRNVITYRERKHYLDQFRIFMEQMNVAEGTEWHYTYSDLKQDGFFDLKVKDREVITVEELLQDKRYLENGYKCIVITGRLGSGKTILGCRMAERIIESLSGGQWCIVWSSYCTEGQFGKDSKRYFWDFMNKVLPKRGKIVVIIDDIGELLVKGKLKNIGKFFDAAQYYNATLILICRRAYVETLKGNRMPITKIWSMLSLDIEDNARDSIIQNLPVKDEMNEVRKLPLFRKITNEMLDADEKEERNTLENNFLFQEECYAALMRREKIKNRIDDSDMKALELFMKEVAFQMYQYRGGSVTLNVCASEFSDNNSLQKLVKTEIFLEMLEVDKQLKENYLEWYIKGFVYSWLESFFLTKKIVDIYLQNDRPKMETIHKNKVSEKYKKMIETLYFTLPEDKKEKIRKNAEKSGI
ncbi:MAG: hypothetical protein K2N80_08885 [Lachnospiraceae bacterium]|nr:hypothetical protein [Lachnospiraceae bacterium]